MTQFQRDFNGLPDNWTCTELENIVSNPKNDIVDGPFGSNLKASEYVDDGVPIIRLQNIDRNKFINKNIKFISQKKAEQLKRHSFLGRDIVLTKLGDPLGKACIVPENFGPGLIVADVVRIRLDEDYISKKYLVYAINSEPAIKQFDLKIKGTTRPRVNLTHIRKLRIPISPLQEQHRIVAKVDELFSSLDAGVEGLHKAKVQLKHYRQAVLKAAMEGRLTEEWRKSHPEVEPANKLLDRVQEERRRKLGKKYAPLKFDSANLSKLPDGWIWISIEQVAQVETGATPLRTNTKYYDGGEIPWVTSGSLNDSFINEADEFITELAIKETNAKVFPIHALLIAMYGEGKTRGKVSELLIEAATNQACAALLFEGTAESIRPYIKIFFEKNYEDIRRLSSGGVQPNLNLSIIKATKIPLPPLDELESIIKEIENNLAQMDEVNTSLNQNMKRADNLRQSILKLAFKGNLVPHDPNDQPASMLLDRIKAGRSREESSHKIKKKLGPMKESQYHPSTLSEFSG